jgi:hypothetical protein
VIRVATTSDSVQSHSSHRYGLYVCVCVVLVQPFELIDKSKRGIRKILVFFLCDPSEPVVSTATVPPQQLSWFRHTDASAFHSGLKEATPLIEDLAHIVQEYLYGQLCAFSYCCSAWLRGSHWTHLYFFVLLDTFCFVQMKSV